MRPMVDSERNTESGVTFNGIEIFCFKKTKSLTIMGKTTVGNGYMQFDVGSWNPRKRTVILLSFMTYSPDGKRLLCPHFVTNFRFILGLLFFIGKDRDQLLVELVDGRVRYS